MPDIPDVKKRHRLGKGPDKNTLALGLVNHTAIIFEFQGLVYPELNDNLTLGETRGEYEVTITAIEFNDPLLGLLGDKEEWMIKGYVKVKGRTKEFIGTYNTLLQRGWVDFIRGGKG